MNTRCPGAPAGVAAVVTVGNMSCLVMDSVGVAGAGVPVLSEVVLRCCRGDVAAGVRHLDSIVRAGREAEGRIEQMGYGVNIFPPFA